MELTNPAQIERESMAIIARELQTPRSSCA